LVFKQEGMQREVVTCEYSGVVWVRHGRPPELEACRWCDG
jgi:hypothetical protein